MAIAIEFTLIYDLRGKKIWRKCRNVMGRGGLGATLVQGKCKFLCEEIRLFSPKVVGLVSRGAGVSKTCFSYVSFFGEGSR